VVRIRSWTTTLCTTICFATARGGATLGPAPRAAAERTLRAVTEGRVTTIDGGEIKVRADSICVHFDTPGAVAVAEAVRAIL
jgi:UPF0271 protein